jgi:hypothetical protein
MQTELSRHFSDTERERAEIDITNEKGERMVQVES